MKHILLLFVLLQSMSVTVMAEKKEKTEIRDSVDADHLPMFPGGSKAFYDYLSQNVRYMEEAEFKHEQDSIVVGFVVEMDGKISHVNIEKFVSKPLAKEVLRVIKDMPQWTPGLFKGKPVRVAVSKSIRFRLYCNNYRIVDVGGKLEMKSVVVPENHKNDSLQHRGRLSFPKQIEYTKFGLVVHNIKYPEKAELRGDEGWVIVGFVVDEEGKISDVKIEQSAAKYLDEEALRAVSNIHQWDYVCFNGKPVRVKCSMSFVFRLNKRYTGSVKSGKVRTRGTNIKVGLPIIKDVLYTSYSLSTPLELQTEIKQETKVFDVVKQMPSFPGGQQELFKFISQNIKYPAVAEENGIQGKVVVQFIVMPNGLTDSIKVVKSVDPSLDKEAARVILSMPKWNPGMKDGQPVKVRYTLPVNFRLQNDDGTKPSYPGGDAAFSKFLAENLKYPSTAKKKGIQGVVVIQVTVEADGTLTNPTISKPVDSDLDAEALRIVMKMPRWNPGKDKDGNAKKKLSQIWVPFSIK